MAAPIVALLETVVSSLVFNLSKYAALMVVRPWLVKAVCMCVMPEALMLMEEPDLALLLTVVFNLVLMVSRYGALVVVYP
jgi:hypothetical protein